MRRGPAESMEVALAAPTITGLAGTGTDRGSVFQLCVEGLDRTS